MRYDCNKLDEQARLLFKEERALTRLDGWFILRENILAYEEEHKKALRGGQFLHFILRPDEEESCQLLPFYHDPHGAGLPGYPPGCGGPDLPTFSNSDRRVSAGVFPLFSVPCPAAAPGTARPWLSEHHDPGGAPPLCLPGILQGQYRIH